LVTNGKEKKKRKEKTKRLICLTKEVHSASTSNMEDKFGGAVSRNTNFS